MRAQFPRVGLKHFAHLRYAKEYEAFALLGLMDSYCGAFRFSRLEAAAETYAQPDLIETVFEATGVKRDLIRDFIVSSRELDSFTLFRDRVGQETFDVVSLELLRLQWGSEGIERNLNWHTSSAPAQYAVGILHLDGVNGGVNQEEAVRFFKMAAGQGDEEARKALYSACEQRYPPLACEGVSNRKRGLLDRFFGS